MKRLVASFISICAVIASYAQADTLYLSSSFTTHVRFQTDLSYVDLSDTRLVAAMIVEQCKNVLALKACQSFKGATSVTAIESSRKIHPFIVVYDANPKLLVVDYSMAEDTAKIGRQLAGRTSGMRHSMEEIHSMKRGLFHIEKKQNDIAVSCDNLLSYGDVLYLSLSLENRSSTDYRIEGASFCVEPRKRLDRTALQTRPVFARNRYGNLSAGPGGRSSEVYAFDKMTLSKGQVLRIYFYESDDQRNIVLDIDWRDINAAQRGR